ncbi:MAG: hypothetical protein ACE5EQ_09980 [Phycisphaerae bacterium]
MMRIETCSRIGSENPLGIALPIDDCDGFTLQTIVDLLDRHVRAKPDERQAQPAQEPLLAP